MKWLTGVYFVVFIGQKVQPSKAKSASRNQLQGVIALRLRTGLRRTIHALGPTSFVSDVESTDRGNNQ